MFDLSSTSSGISQYRIISLLTTQASRFPNLPITREQVTNICMKFHEVTLRFKFRSL